MPSHKKWFSLTVLLTIMGMLLAACGPTATPQPPAQVTVPPGVTVVERTVPVKETAVVVITPTPVPIERNGAWVDTIIFVEEPDTNIAVSRLEAGDIDVFAYNVSEPEPAQKIYELTDAGVLKYYTSYGNYNELTFNPVPTFEDGRLNPFGNPKIREAMNWLVDRDYVAQEISGGMARPRFVPINYASKDTALLADVIAEISLKYAYNPEKAKEVITAEMEAMGAELVDGKWTYKGEPIVLVALIRTEDERLEIGDYVSTLLEDVGFTVDRQYKTSAEAATCWLRSEPATGCFSFYTGGWVTTAISRDEGSNFSFFYTARGYPVPLWLAYTPSEEFDTVAERLEISDYASMEERRELMAEALRLALEDSVRVWLKDDVGIAPLSADLSLASDLSGSIYGSSLWALTLKYKDQVGGSVTIAMPSMMTEPWNPIGGSNWIYDMMPLRGMQSPATVPDPFTGLMLPNRLAKAELFAKTGLPIGQNMDWVTLQFVDSIEVPADAWVDWDAANQVFVTAAEKYTQTVTATTRVVMYYEDDYFAKMKWHDGSPVTLADHIMYMILQFDQSKPESAIYDESTLPAFETFMSAFKGWKIVSKDPLVIEYYTDAYALDAENNVSDSRAAHSAAFQNGEAAWHNLTVGILTEAAGEAAFSTDKADALQIEQLNYISGPTLEIMKAHLDTAQAENYIPYAPTLGQYITADEAAARYANLQEWYRRRGHFHIATGPFYLERAFPIEGTLILQRNPEYPDSANKWLRFAEAPIPEVLVDGPGAVTIGDEATYDLFVEFQDAPYPVDDISMVKFLVFDATGALAHSGEAEAVEDGHWQVVLSADVTGKLAAGSNRLAVIVVSKRALVPVTEVLEFVSQ